MLPGEDKNRIERLSQKLYSRKTDSIVDSNQSSDWTNKQYEVRDDFGGKERIDDFMQNPTVAKKRKSFIKIFFWLAVVFFLISLVFVSFAIFGGWNTISSKNVDIQILGPVSIAGGEELPLEIIVTNGNSAPLESTNLKIEYPKGTRSAQNVEKELIRESQSLGVIDSGDSVHHAISSIMFGEKDSMQTILVTLEYRVKGSNALFSKEQSYDVSIASSPLVLNAIYPGEVTSNKEFDITLELSSNSTSILKNILVSAEYPFGFTFVSAVPTPVFNDSVWKIGDLSPGEKRTIKLKGKILGQDNEERTLRFGAGIASDRDNRVIGTEFVSVLKSLSIQKPGIGTDIFVGNSSGAEHVTTSGDKVSANVRFTNNLTVPLVNGRVEVKLSGSVLDKSSVTVSSGGFYRSIDNTIVWESSSAPALASIAPGQQGTFSFQFKTSGGLGISSSNQSVSIDVAASASQLSGGSTPELVSSVSSTEIKVASNIGLSSRLVYSVGPFSNHGPVPPKVDTETTYTVIWTVTNSSNDVADAKVQATLPQYVSWLGAIAPAQEKVSFDPLSRLITWDVGELAGGIGFGTSPREVYFQLSIIPSISQLGDAPVILNASSLIGRDRFTNASLQDSSSSVNTRIGTDPIFTNGDERVVQ